MPLMCPLKGCEAKKGMCGHEKFMVFMVIVGSISFAAWNLYS